MSKKLERWTEGCAFERLAKLHPGMNIGFTTPTVWEIDTQGVTAHIRKEGCEIGRVDLESGTYIAEGNSLMFQKMIQNLVDRINEGKNYNSYQQYAKAIETKYLELARKANDRYQEVYEALYPERVGKIYR